MQIDRISVLIPVMNNAQTLVELADRVHAAVQPLTQRVQLVFVDDKSTDNSLNVIKEIVLRTSETVVLMNEVNRGQQLSLHKGLSACDGDVVVVMDADLQDPPEAIPVLIETLLVGEFDSVFATRIGRYQSLPRMITSYVFRFVMRCLTNLPKGAGGFVAMRAEVARKLAGRPEGRFYLAGLIGCGGYKLAGIPVLRDWRAHGHSAYTMGMRLSVALKNVLTVIGERMTHAGR